MASRSMTDPDDHCVALQARAGVEHWTTRAQQIMAMQFTEEDRMSLEEAMATFPYGDITGQSCWQWLQLAGVGTGFSGNSLSQVMYPKNC